MELGELVWKITGDTSGIKKSLKNTEKGIAKMGKTTSGIGKLFKTAFAVVGVAAIVKFGKSLITAASNAEETAGKFGVVFDSVIDEANKLSGVLTSQYGLAREESQNLLAATGDLLVGFGVAKDEALSLSFQVQTLAVDLASFSNFAGGATGASKALTAALLGETESAKALGLALGENQLRKYAEDQGKVFKNLTQNEKMFLRLKLAVSQSGSAIGDFNRTINSFANQSRIAQARIKDMQATLGKGLLPLANIAVKLFNENADALQGMADSFVEFVKSAEGAKKIGDVIGTIAGAFRVFGIIIGKVIDLFGDFIDELRISVGEVGKISPAAQDASTAISVLSNVVQFGASLFKVLGVAIGATVANIVNLIDVVIESAKVVGSFFSALAGKGSWAEFKKQASEAGTAYQTFGNDIVEGTNRIFDTALNEVVNFEDNQKKLAKSIQDAFTSTSEGVSAAVQTALTAQEAQAKAAEQANKDAEKSAKSAKTSIQDIAEAYKVGTSQIVGLLGAIDTYQKAIAQSRIAEVDAQMEAELEAAGLAENSAVEAAELELARAEREGSEEEKRIAQQALTRAQIEEKFAKKKAQIEYESAVASWEIQKAMAAIQLVAAPLNAYVSSLATPIIGPYIAPINAALAGVAAGLQYAAVVEAKPIKPSFQHGGIIPGSSFSGDNVDISANSREAVITEQQQKNFLDLANGGGGGQEAFRVVADRQTTFDELFQASQNGELFIAKRAVQAR